VSLEALFQVLGGRKEIFKTVSVITFCKSKSFTVNSRVLSVPSSDFEELHRQIRRNIGKQMEKKIFFKLIPLKNESLESLGDSRDS